MKNSLQQWIYTGIIRLIHLIYILHMSGKFLKTRVSSILQKLRKNKRQK